jgi:hypothetical protein
MPLAVGRLIITLIKGGIAMTQISFEQMEEISGGDWCDAICTLVIYCAAFWPIGTLICGPTAAVVCLSKIAGLWDCPGSGGRE